VQSRAEARVITTVASVVVREKWETREGRGCIYLERTQVLDRRRQIESSKLNSSDRHSDRAENKRTSLDWSNPRTYMAFQGKARRDELNEAIFPLSAA
jgi:hypothetical protein